MKLFFIVELENGVHLKQNVAGVLKNCDEMLQKPYILDRSPYSLVE